MQQYFQAKEEHPGVLIAMRVGDFYEFYGEDAEIAAAALQITLTGRDDAASGKIPMAGVPHHSVEKYLAKLIQQGLKVAICDQLEDPKQAKGIVKRGVTRVLTPGTLLEDSMLDASQSNFLVAICVQDGKAGLAVLEPSTGEFLVTEISGESLEDRLLQELARLKPTELLIGPDLDPLGELAKNHLNSSVTSEKPLAGDRASRKVRDKFEVRNLQGFGIDEKSTAVVAASMILGYAEKNRLPLQHVESISTYSTESYMRIDMATRRSLELTSNLFDGTRRHTVLSVLDSTQTPMGARLLRKWVEQPLLDAHAIQGRLDSVERFHGHALARGDLRDAMKRVQDLERLVSRASAGLASPRDLVALKNSLHALPDLAEPLRKLGVGRIQELRERLGDHFELYSLLDKALVKEPPMTLRDGGVIAEGYDQELDILRNLAKNGKSFIAALETEERSKTGIATLKVGYNSVFGYYLEVPKSQIEKVPAEYIRKQTTANAERYITADLKEHESQVLGAEEKSVSLESDLFHSVRLRVAEQSQELLKTARALAEIDVLSSLAEVALKLGYVKPKLSEEDVILVTGGRHPVVEATTSSFVPNDSELDRTRLMLITGPNMSGKSTYLRQTALIVLLAQIGSFVPARQCEIGICDRIFARIGAKDELALGQSTFMVEMVESANILNHATSQSLVILDEVGRGTSTYDGLAIAWSMVEYLSEVGAKTLFATHYHQLNSLAETLPNVENFRVAVEERGDDIVWTHRVLPGGTDRSYGIHVARMAGVPSVVLKRASDVLADLEQRGESPTVRHQTLQMTLFEPDELPLKKELDSVDVNRLTPIEALQLLDRWKKNFGS